MNKDSINSDSIETVIGLEVHLQFGTKTKIFCSCANEFGNAPNTNTCPVCLGLPGSLPVLNKTALKYALKVALALNCQINSFIKFDRKNYYYPDLPKGYQISQYDFPIGHDGYVEVKTETGSQNIRIHRAHLEEDAGKLIHCPGEQCSLVDYNRTGTPLMEIVTEPDMRSSQEAYDYLQTLKRILQYLDVSDCDMEKGSLRCDANISVRKKGEAKLGTKAEIKNLNSFKAVKSALEFEQKRQSQLLITGQEIKQETRLWDDEKELTLPMRTKEEAHDYRYFPEPDLVPFTVSLDEIDEIRQDIPELPDEKSARFRQDYDLSDYDARLLTQDRILAQFFEDCCKGGISPKKICNWIAGPLMKELNDRRTSIRAIDLKPESFTRLIAHVENSTVSNLVGKDILQMMLDTHKDIDKIITDEGLAQVSDDGFLTEILDAVIKENGNIVSQIKDGNTNAIGFLIGQAMKKSKGKANPKKIGELLTRRLHNE